MDRAQQSLATLSEILDEAAVLVARSGMASALAERIEEIRRELLGGAATGALEQEIVSLRERAARAPA